jgi:signal transduction histidine kinase
LQNKETGKRTDELEFYAKDIGVGIPIDIKTSIFKRFIQGDISNKRACQGAGLSLSISKAYVEIIGGKIGVESEEKKELSETLNLLTITEEIFDEVCAALQHKIKELKTKKIKWTLHKTTSIISIKNTRNCCCNSCYFVYC